MARWVRVLEAFASSGEWGIRDLARATDIPRSAAHRILHDMAAHGLLVPADEPGRFRVGADLARIGLLVAEHLDIRREGRPFLERASAAIGETVVIAVYDPVRRQFSAVDAVETSHPIRYLWESLRDWSDLHLGSSGKGILAFLPADEQAATLDRLPDPVPGRNAVTKAQLREELEGARQRGFVVSHGERYEGAVGVAAPVRDARGRVVGDVIATWPDNRTDDAKEAAAGIVVRTAADDLSRRLGWGGPGADATAAPATAAATATAVRS
jgi:DNA-binding IclR family transcriptional regulator